MRGFVTGASGWIGSATVTELPAAGHEVLGTARLDAAAWTIAGLGAEVHRGSLDSLREGTAGCDARVHLGYNHDFSHMEQAAQTDRRVIETLGAVPEAAAALAWPRATTSSHRRSDLSVRGAPGVHMGNPGQRRAGGACTADRS